MNIDLTPIFQAVISVVSVVALLYLVPFIKRKVSAEKLSQILKWVETLVACADQIYNRHEGAEKKQYVIDRLLAILDEYGLFVDVAVLEDLVEAEVLRLHSELKALDVVEEDDTPIEDGDDAEEFLDGQTTTEEELAEETAEN